MAFKKIFNWQDICICVLVMHTNHFDNHARTEVS